MMTRSLAYMVSTYLGETGIFGASVHRQRHTNGTHQVARGTNRKTVQVTLGHASLAPTLSYVSLSKRAQKKARQAHALPVHFVPSCGRYQ